MVCGSGTAIVNQITLTGGKDTGLGQLVGQINLTLSDLCALTEVQVGGHEFQVGQQGVELWGHSARTVGA